MEHAPLSESQWKHALILNSVQAMLDHPGKASLETFLDYKDRHHDTSSLLLIKKWGDFFLQNQSIYQQMPHLHFQLSRLNLEIAIQARKERNFDLSKRHLIQHLGCPDSNGLMDFIENIDFNNQTMFLSTDKARCLRQSAKLSFVLQNQEDPEKSGGKIRNKTVAVQVLCGIGAISLRSPSNPDLTTIAARSFNTLAKWLRKNPQLMDPDVITGSENSVSLNQILAHQPVSEVLSKENELLMSETCSDNDMVIGRLLKLATNLVSFSYKYQIRISYLVGFFNLQKRQYKIDSIWSKNKLNLKLPLFLNIRKNSEIDDIFLRRQLFVDFQTYFKNSLYLE